MKDYSTTKYCCPLNTMELSCLKTAHIPFILCINFQSSIDHSRIIPQQRSGSCNCFGHRIRNSLKQKGNIQYIYIEVEFEMLRK